MFAKSVNFFIINIRYYTAEITKICNVAALLSVFSTLTRESLNLSPNLLHTQINEICENENTRIDTNFFFVSLMCFVEVVSIKKIKMEPIAVRFPIYFFTYLKAALFLLTKHSLVC